MPCKCGDSGERLASLPLAGVQAFTQVTFDPFARPLPFACHSAMIATVIRQPPSLSALTLELLVSLVSLAVAWRQQEAALGGAPVRGLAGREVRLKDPAGDALADDLAKLSAAHSDWFFTSTWAAAGFGPDRRMLIAHRSGVVLSDFSVAALEAKIQAEDRR